MLSLEQGAHLVSIARKAIDTVVVEGRVIEEDSLPHWSGGSDEFLRRRRGAFVTLNKPDGELRGCIGIPYPLKPLWEADVHSAVGAALHDPRFARVEAKELDSLTVEVSALTEPEPVEAKPLELPSRVRIGTDGLIVTGKDTSGLLLPQVATEMGLTPETFLSLTCEKAGLPADAWLIGKVKVLRFQAEVFVEATPRGSVGGLRARV